MKKGKTKYVKICPKCKSLNVRLDLMSGWFIGFPAGYKCQDCGHSSKLFPEVNLLDIKK